MGASTKRKPIYAIDDIASMLDLNLVDVRALVVEQALRFCTAVAALPVETGFWEEPGTGSAYRVPEEYRDITGLVDLRPQDALAVLRNGSATLQWLDAEMPRYVRIGGADPKHPGLTVHRHEIGIRPVDMKTLQAVYGVEADAGVSVPVRQRGPQPIHNWRAIELEGFRICFFEGVPESKNALIRHLQGWCKETGRPVPDESTLKRELREFWDVFAPEARPRTPEPGGAGKNRRPER